jgi:hypothetical protein
VPDRKVLNSAIGSGGAEPSTDVVPRAKAKSHIPEPPACPHAGKTTLLKCLAAAIPGGDRVVSAEDVSEFRFPHPK